MNFNSDFQSNQNRLRSTSEVIHLSLDSKTKTKSTYRQVLRFSLEIAFVIFAVGLGYIQGLKSFNTYTSIQTNPVATNHAGNTSASSPEKTEILQNAAPLPENHQDFIPVQPQ